MGLYTANESTVPLVVVPGADVAVTAVWAELATASETAADTDWEIKSNTGLDEDAPPALVTAVLTALVIEIDRELENVAKSVLADAAVMVVEVVPAVVVVDTVDLEVAVTMAADNA